MTIMMYDRWLIHKNATISQYCNYLNLIQIYLGSKRIKGFNKVNEEQYWWLVIENDDHRISSNNL